MPGRSSSRSASGIPSPALTALLPSGGRPRRRVSYRFDEANRLLARGPGHGARRPVRPLPGRVGVDAANRLLYHVDAPRGQHRAANPRTLIFDGRWTLSRAHELGLVLPGGRWRSRQLLRLRGAVVRAEAHALLFALRRPAEAGASQAAQELRLSGRWQADARNRLTFFVEKSSGREDRLTLQGGWSVGSRHEVLYRVRQNGVSADGRREHTVVFDGYWQIAQADRLVYRLAGSSVSAFEFKASLQSSSLIARDGRIVYQLGIGLTGGRTRPYRLVLFGAWKLHRDLSVSFEIPYAGGRVDAFRGEADIALSRRDRVALALRDRRGRPVGLTVTFTRDVAPDVQLFLRLRREAEEQSVLGGAQVRF